MEGGGVATIDTMHIDTHIAMRGACRELGISESLCNLVNCGIRKRQCSDASRPLGPHIQKGTLED